MLVAAVLVIEEVHVDGVPVESGDLGFAVAAAETVTVLAGLAVSVFELFFAASHIGHADASFGEVVISAN